VRVLNERNLRDCGKFPPKIVDLVEGIGDGGDDTKRSPTTILHLMNLMEQVQWLPSSTRSAKEWVPRQVGFFTTNLWTSPVTRVWLIFPHHV